LRGLRAAPEGLSGGVSGFGHSRGWWNVDDVPVLWDESRASRFLEKDLETLMDQGHYTRSETDQTFNYLQGPAWERTYRSPAEDLARQLAEFSSPENPITISPELYDPQQIMDLSLGEHTPQFMVNMPGGEFMDPTFGAMRRHGKWEVSDILQAGDEDFFGSNIDLQNRYFSAIDRLQGADPQELMNLYRAMSPEEFDSWIVGNPISSGKFFTDQPTAGYASDFASNQRAELYGPFQVRRGDFYQVGDNEFQTKGHMFYDQVTDPTEPNLVTPDTPLSRGNYTAADESRQRLENARQELIRRFSFGVNPDELSAFFSDLPELPPNAMAGMSAADRVGQVLPEGMWRAGPFNPADFHDMGYSSFQSRIPFLHQGGTPAEAIFSRSPMSLREVLSELGLTNAEELGMWMAERAKYAGEGGFNEAMKGVPMFGAETDLQMKSLFESAQQPSSVVFGPRGLVHGDVRSEYISPKGYDAWNPWEGGIMLPRALEPGATSMAPVWDMSQANLMDIADAVAGSEELTNYVARPHFYANSGPIGWPGLLHEEMRGMNIPMEDRFPWSWGNASHTSYADPRYMHENFKRLARGMASLNIPFQG